MITRRLKMPALFNGPGGASGSFHLGTGKRKRRAAPAIERHRQLASARFRVIAATLPCASQFNHINDRSVAG